MSLSKYQLGLVLVTGSAVAWSTAGLFTRIIPVDIWTMLAWRGLFGALGIAVVIFSVQRSGAWASLLRMGWPGWLFAIVSAIGMVLFISSLKHTTVAHVAVIYATVPFVAAALAWFVMSERPTASAIIASAAALAGVALMVGLGGDGNLFGDFLAFGMTLSLAVMMVIARRFQGIPVMPAACLSALLSGLACWPVGAPLSVSGSELLLLALFGLVNSAVGLALFTLGARLLPAIETALIGALDAPLAPLWVWLAFGETPSATTIAGGGIVFVAIVGHMAAGAAKAKAPRELAGSAGDIP